MRGFLGAYAKIQTRRQARLSVADVPPAKKTSAAAGGDYSAKNLSLVEGLDHVRQVPGMYIGSTGEKGLHHMAEEVWANSVDEFMAGNGKEIVVEVTADQWCTVTDQGRGIPVDIHKDSGLSGVELVITKLGGGGKFQGKGTGYTVSGGLHGVGVSVVNALSRELRVVVHRDGFEWSMAFKRGIPTGPLKKGKAVKTTGTSISFLYDDQVMAKGLKFDRFTVAERMRELSYLNPGLKLTLKFHGHDDESFVAAGGLADFVKHQATDRGVAAIHRAPVVLAGEVVDTIPDKDGNPTEITSTVDVALLWTEDDHTDTRARSFVNSISTKEGGTHVKGVESALRKVINDVGQELGRFRAKDEPFSREDVREGLIWVVLVRIPNPRFESQTKVKLDNPEVEKRVEKFVIEQLGSWLLERNNREETDKILDRVIEARDSRLAAKKAKDGAKVDRKGVLGGSLPGKLADCIQKGIDGTELFLVEGDSAAGNMKTARDRNTQAVLAMRGKIFNAEKGGDSAIRSQAIKDILATIGGAATTVEVQKKRKGKVVKDFRTVVDVSELRYGKIVLCCDADVDGGHIVALLLTFFLRMAPELLRDGRIYVADLPLFRIEHKKKGRLYLWTPEELERYAKRDEIKKRANGQPMVARFKGLGEMSVAELRELALSPETRQIRRVVIDDINEAESLTDLLMGSKVAPRFEYIQEHALDVEADI